MTFTRNVAKRENSITIGRACISNKEKEPKERIPQRVCCHLRKPIRLSLTSLQRILTKNTLLFSALFFGLSETPIQWLAVHNVKNTISTVANSFQNLIVVSDGGGGVYFYRLEVYPNAVGAGSFVETKKLLLIK